MFYVGEELMVFFGEVVNKVWPVQDVGCARDDARGKSEISVKY